jgi:hypothetical protein
LADQLPTLGSDELVVTFANERPLSSDDLGELFIALARDYRQLTGGRTLVVVRVETGSLYAAFTDAVALVAPYAHDAVELAKAAKGISDFARVLGRLISPPRSSSKIFGRGRKAPGVRSAESLLRIAVNSGSEVIIKHTTAKGETFEAHVTPVEATRLRDEAEARRVSLPAPKGRAQLAKPPLALELYKPSEIADSLAQLYDERAKTGQTSDLEAVIAAVSATPRNAGAGHFLEMIANDLFGRGLHELAAIMRAEAQRSQGNTEPPLLA